MNAPSTSEKIPVWLIEDHADFRHMVAWQINQIGDLHCARAFSNCEDALKALEREPAPQVILCDVGLPGMNGIDGISAIKSIVPAAHIIMLTVYDDHHKVFGAICAGASGYLLKTAPVETIVESIREVYAGGAPMTPRVARSVLEMFGRFMVPAHDYGLTSREQKILELMTQGLIKKEIADQLSISYHTVDTHLRNVYAKLHVNTRGGAVAKALRERLF